MAHNSTRADFAGFQVKQQLDEGTLRERARRVKKQASYAYRFGARNRSLPAGFPADKHPAGRFVPGVLPALWAIRFDGWEPQSG